MAARFTLPRRARSDCTPASWSSRSITRASAGSAACTSSRSKRVCANCSYSDSRRRRDSCAARRAASSSSRALDHATLCQQAPLVQRRAVPHRRLRDRDAPPASSVSTASRFAAARSAAAASCSHRLVAIAELGRRAALRASVSCVALLLHARQRRSDRRLGGASTLQLDQQFARPRLRGRAQLHVRRALMARRSSRSSGELAAPGFELLELARWPYRVRRARVRSDCWARSRSAQHIGGFAFDALEPLRCPAGCVLAWPRVRCGPRSTRDARPGSAAALHRGRIRHPPTCARSSRSCTSSDCTAASRVSQTPRSARMRCSRSSTPACTSPPRTTRSQSRPTHTPSGVTRDSPAASCVARLQRFLQRG